MTEKLLGFNTALHCALRQMTVTLHRQVNKTAISFILLSSSMFGPHLQMWQTKYLLSVLLCWSCWESQRMSKETGMVHGTWFHFIETKITIMFLEDSG